MFTHNKNDLGSNECSYVAATQNSHIAVRIDNPIVRCSSSLQGFARSIQQIDSEEHVSILHQYKQQGKCR